VEQRKRPLENLVNELHSFFSGKRVLLTGHTGFKGAWLALWLHRLGAKIIGLAQDPLYDHGLYHILPKDLFEADLRHDIRNFAGLTQIVENANPDLVFHLAAQPLVRDSYRMPLDTLLTNTLGTAHLLEAVHQSGSKANTFVITSDKVYHNDEQARAFREDDRLGGHDIYSMSKAAAELVAAGWRSSFFTKDSTKGRVITLRAGNVIGGGDFSRDRLIPDCVSAIQGGQPIIIRSPQSTRPWQHVLDCLHGYLLVAARVDATPRDQVDYHSFNFGPAAGKAHTVKEVVETFLEKWPNPPEVIIDSNAATHHEAGYLAVSIEKAQNLLGWQPKWDFPVAIEKSAEWYRAWSESKEDLFALSGTQIAAFEQA
jgi:CDP-glucose 4,6-dehydratase